MRGPLIIGFAIIVDFIQGMLGLSVIALQVLPFIGQMASALAGAVGEVISFTLGAALVIALIFTGQFSWGAIFGGSMIEMIPVLNLFVPGWTLMAWRCVHNTKMAEQAKQTAAPVAADRPAPAQAFDGIRAANDNTLYEQVAA